MTKLIRMKADSPFELPDAAEWGSPLPGLLRVFENALDVTHLAQTELEYLEPDWPLDQALQWLRARGFDAAPVRDQRPYRFVATEDPSVSATVDAAARPIDSSLLVSSSLSLADGVELLRHIPFYFVLDRLSLAGIVTRADLQRPAVGMVTLSLILAAEAGISSVILKRLGDNWMAHLGVTLGEVEDIFEQRKKANTEITLVECMMLHHRLDLLSKCDVFEGLGFSAPKDFDDWRGRLIRLRNNLAHGGTILHAEPDPVAAIDLFLDVRRFAEAVWETAELGENGT